MPEKALTRRQREQFLERVRALVEYWDGQGGSVPESHTSRQRLEGLAYSILTAIDQGELALIPAGLLEAVDLDEADISGELNDLLFGRGIWSND